jgi:hypothetical protein
LTPEVTGARIPLEPDGASAVDRLLAAAQAGLDRVHPADLGVARATDLVGGYRAWRAEATRDG